MKGLIEQGFVLDGAMGTQLIERGLSQGESSSIWNLRRPEDILAVHRSYAEAGAQAIIANTFAANRLMLSRHDLVAEMEPINRIAIELARETGLPVLADIGPCGDFLEPYGDLEDEDLAAMVRDQAEVLAKAGADGFIVETMSDPSELSLSVRTLKEYGLPVVASFTYEKGPTGLQTMMGIRPDESLWACEEADAMGANCGTSMSLDDYLGLAAILVARAEGKPVVLQPNAGAPNQEVSGLGYEATPEDFGRFAMEARKLGVRIIGGCCGTTPQYIRRVKEAFESAVS